MRIKIIILMMLIMVFGAEDLVVADCPEQPSDNGICDTLYAVCHDTVKIDPPPWEVHISLLVTHDVPMPSVDSIASFLIPLRFSHTNPAAYCSIPSWRNSTSFSDSANSIFRHFGGKQNRMMSWYEEGNGAEWNDIILDLYHPYFLFSLVPAGAEDQRWGEGSEILLATITFLVEDTMTIRIDTTIFGPTEPRLTFARSDAVCYIPRDNMPYYVNILNTVRGDANGDQVIDITDIMYMINYLFRHGPAPVSFEAGDANCDDDHGILDVVYLINYLYKNGSAPHCP